jgi:hypothetical protein
MLPSSLLLVRQNFPDRHLADVPAEARRQLEHSSFAARLRPGARIAIGVLPPSLLLLLTGTGIIPPHEFSMVRGDTVRVTIADLTLENTVAPR